MASINRQIGQLEDQISPAYQSQAKLSASAQPGVSMQVESTIVLSPAVELGSSVVGSKVVGSSVVDSKVVGSSVVGSKVVGSSVVGADVGSTDVDSEVGSSVEGPFIHSHGAI